VAIINETLARRFWPNEDPINKQIKFGASPTAAIPWRSIIGVVEDVKHWEITTNPEPEIYVPHLQGSPTSSMFLVMRTASPPTSVIGAMKSEVWAVDKDQPIGSIRAMGQILSDSIARERLFMLVLGIFSTVAFVLAAVGVYGVINYLVTQRTHEIGVRLALGAQRRDVLRLIIRQGMAPALIGVSLGIAGSFALTRVLSQLLYGVSPTDPETFTAISLLISGVALLASYIPARRASKIDPIVALRNQ
jgi:putative ABC transport system permease protein